ncbi:MAG: hypothetical protein V4621_04720 [Pseudomonadota bacterium]
MKNASLALIGLFATAGCASFSGPSTPSSQLCPGPYVSQKLFAEFAKRNGYEAPAYVVNDGKITFVNLCEAAANNTGDTTHYRGDCIVTNDKFVPGPVYCPNVAATDPRCEPGTLKHVLESRQNETGQQIERVQLAVLENGKPAATVYILAKAPGNNAQISAPRDRILCEYIAPKASL